MNWFVRQFLPLMYPVSDLDALVSVAEANKVLVRWVQDHSYIDRHCLGRAQAYLTAHYTLFIQMREALLADNSITKHEAEETTRIADYPFSLKARKEIDTYIAQEKLAQEKPAVPVPSLAPFPLNPSPFESQKSM